MTADTGARGGAVTRGSGEGTAGSASGEDALVPAVAVAGGTAGAGAAVVIEVGTSGAAGVGNGGDAVPVRAERSRDLDSHPQPATATEAEVSPPVARVVEDRDGSAATGSEPGGGVPIAAMVADLPAATGVEGGDAIPAQVKRSRDRAGGSATGTATRGSDGTTPEAGSTTGSDTPLTPGGHDPVEAIAVDAAAGTGSGGDAIPAQAERSRDLGAEPDDTAPADDTAPDHAIPVQPGRSSVLAAETEPEPDGTAKPATPALRGVALGGIANLAGSAVSGGAGLVITWLVAAALGPAGAGLFFAATSAFLIAISLARLGTPTGLVYWIARLKAAGAFGAVRGVLRIALTPVVVVSVILGVVGFLGAGEIAELHGPDPAHADDYARLLRILAVFVPAATILDTVLAATRGLSTMKPTVWIERLGRVLAQLALLGTAVAVSTGETAPEWVTLAWVLPYVPAALAAWWWLRKRIRAREGANAGGTTGTDTGTAPPEAPAVTRGDFWRYTGPRALASVAQFALQRLDILLVAGMLGFPQAALYTVATRFVIAGQLANLAVGSSLQPRIAAALSTKDIPAARSLYRHTTTWIVLLSWPMYLTAAVLAPEYLRLFGGEYDTGTAVLVVRILAVAMLVGSACGTVDSVLAMSGRTSWQLSNVVLALVANVSIDLWLMPRIGVVGAAIGWAAAVLANNLVPLAQLGLAERLHPFGRSGALAMAAAAGCFAVLPATAALVVGGGARLPATVCGGLMYACLLWRFRGALLTRHLK